MPRWLRTVRVRTTLAATVVVAVVLIAAVAVLVSAVEQTLVGRARSEAAAEVAAIADRLAAGASPLDALEARPTSGIASTGVPTMVEIVDHEGRSVLNVPDSDALLGVTSELLQQLEVLPDEPGVTRVGSTDLAIAQETVEVDGRSLTVIAASPLAQIVRSVEAITRTSAVGVPLLVLLVGAVTWTATGRTLRPIERIRAEVDDLSSQTLDRRVPVPDTGDEVAHLAHTMNHMLGRLETASTRQREFISDASHELRSPVASIRIELEVALAHPAVSNWPEVAAAALSETERLERLVEDLILLARLDEERILAAETVDIRRLVQRQAERVSAAVTVEHGDALVVTGREADLDSVLRNLLDNAARHATSEVAVTATVRDGMVVITVDDDGPGIRPADRERVFSRFTRLEHARSRGGVGLGLAIVDRVVQRQGGTLTVGDTPKGGARFEVTLPAARRNTTQR
jgi:signal transduction histidine kinase